MEILHHLSNWLSVLEERGTVPGKTFPSNSLLEGIHFAGTSMGQMIGALAAFEDNLTSEPHFMISEVSNEIFA